MYTNQSMVNQSGKSPTPSHLFPSLTKPRLAWAIIATSLILGFWFNYSFWQQLPGLAVAIYVIVATTATYWLITSAGQSWPKPAWGIVILELLIAGFVAWHASPWLTLLNLAAMFGLALLAVHLILDQPWQQSLANYLFLALLPFFWLRPARQTLQNLTLTTPANHHRQQLKSILTGLLVALPAVAILLTLFSSADSIFASYLPHLSQFSLQPQTIVQLCLILVVAGWFAAALSAIIWRGSASAKSYADGQLLPTTESTVVLTAINLVFALFVTVQIAYLFGGEAYLAAHHTTYAEYARQGFTQLVLTALVAATMLWLTKPQQRNSSVALRWLGVALCGQVLIVLASAMSRLWLYEQTYGFTIARLAGHTAMIWLIFFFLILLVQIFRHFSTSQAGSLVLGLTLITVIALNAFNPENFIVQQNIDRYHQTGKIDLSYLSRLSTDAIPALVTFQHQADTKTADQLQAYLANYDALHGHPTSWQSWNYSRQQACRLLHCQPETASYGQAQIHLIGATPPPSAQLLAPNP